MIANFKRPGLIWPSLVTIGALAGILLASKPADAAPLCNQRTTVLSTLDRDYGEKPIAFGVTGDGSLVQIVAAKGGSTWTLVIHAPNGTSCLIAAGENWRKLPKREKFALQAGGPR